MNIIIYVNYNDLEEVEKLENGITDVEKVIDFRLSPLKTLDGTGYVQCIVKRSTLRVLTEINEHKKV